MFINMFWNIELSSKSGDITRHIIFTYYIYIFVSMFYMLTWHLADEFQLYWLLYHVGAMSRDLVY